MLEDKEILSLISETEKVYLSALDKGLQDNDIPEQMLQALKKDIFVFSGCKTHSELNQVARLLLTEDSKVKGFAAFQKDVQKIYKDYNENYLQAEHVFAVSSSEMAAKWNDLTEGKDRYNLQYRTAGDDRVRDEHAALANVTLDMEDPFWDEYYPPNGWRCRCTAVQVRKGKYPESNSSDSIAKGVKATSKINKKGENTAAMFRFNPGKSKQIFPPHHPYRKVSEKVGQTIDGLYSSQRKQLGRAIDKEVAIWAKETIPTGGGEINLKNFKTGSAVILRKNVRSISEHFASPDLKRMAFDIQKICKASKYIASAPLDDDKGHKKSRRVTGYNYYSFTYQNEAYRLNVEIIDGKEYPYSINKIITAD